MCIYPQALFSVPLVYMSVFIPVSFHIDYCSFVINFEVTKYEASSFVFISQDCFGHSESFMIAYAFYKFFVISSKNAIGILVGIALNL